MSRHPTAVLVSVMSLTVLASSRPSHARSGSLADWIGLGHSDSRVASEPQLRNLEPSLNRFTDALREVRADPGIRDLLKTASVHSLSVTQRVTSSDLETTKLQDYYKGIEVIGSMAYHRRGRAGNTVVDHIARFDLDTHPTLTEAQSVAIARSLAGDRPLNGKPELKILPAEREKNEARLIYWVRLQPRGLDGARDILIDAHSGQVIANLSRDIQIAPIQVFSAKGQGMRLQEEVDGGDGSRPHLTGCKLSDLASGDERELDARECRSIETESLPDTGCQFVLGREPRGIHAAECKPGSSDDSVATQARENATAVLNYYDQHHHRNSYDDQGSTVVSVIHGGVGYSNAFWSMDRKIMVYGDGDPAQGLGSFANALDVAGHEMTHGVTQATAGLMMMSQNGALNEANSDFFGIMIAGHRDWAIGKGVWIDPSQSKGIRDLAKPDNLSFPAGLDDSGNPVQVPYPTKIGDLIPDEDTCDLSNDYCWIHENATIVGHALYLITQAIGPEKAEHLQYVVLTQALGPGDTIRSAAESTKHVCDQIYDAGTCDAVRQAYAQIDL